MHACCNSGELCLRTPRRGGVIQASELGVLLARTAAGPVRADAVSAAITLRWGHMSFTDVDLARLLIALAVLLLAAHGVGALFARFRQPPAIGEIFGGILLGPSALGAAFPEAQHWIFPATGSSA